MDFKKITSCDVGMHLGKLHDTCNSV